MYNLFSATDFNDSVDHFNKLQPREGMERAVKNDSMEIKYLDEIDRSKFRTKPMIRDFGYYKEILERGGTC